VSCIPGSTECIHWDWVPFNSDLLDWVFDCHGFVLSGWSSIFCCNRFSWEDLSHGVCLWIRSFTPSPSLASEVMCFSFVMSRIINAITDMDCSMLGTGPCVKLWAIFIVLMNDVFHITHNARIVRDSRFIMMCCLSIMFVAHTKALETQMAVVSFVTVV